MAQRAISLAKGCRRRRAAQRASLSARDCGIMQVAGAGCSSNSAEESLARICIYMCRMSKHRQERDAQGMASLLSGGRQHRARTRLAALLLASLCCLLARSLRRLLGVRRGGTRAGRAGHEVQEHARPARAAQLVRLQVATRRGGEGRTQWPSVCWCAGAPRAVHTRAP